LRLWKRFHQRIRETWETHLLVIIHLRAPPKNPQFHQMKVVRKERKIRQMRKKGRKKRTPKSPKMRMTCWRYPSTRND